VGAVAAAVVGVDERVGLFALTLALAATMAGFGRHGAVDDVGIGVVFSWVLGIGVLLIAVLSETGGGNDGLLLANTLFGSIFGLSAGQSAIAAVIGLGVALGAITIARPLLFASIDAELAFLHGVPVRALGVALLGLLGAVTAEGTQAIGALLVLGLLAAPAGAALHLTARPYLGMAISGAIAIAAMWGGLALAYVLPSLPPGTAIVALCVAAYGGAAVAVRIARAFRAGAPGARAKGPSRGLPSPSR
jgi:zinc/manganese transport system permease protein